jgi:galactose mutarotase-like enzyme
MTPAAPTLAPTDWYGFSAWQLESEQMRVVVVPALGAKIASLVDKVTGEEWLLPPSRPIRPRSYGDVFVEHDLSGWDEMFPTINACPAPHLPQRQLPDHGEVWALAWDVNLQDAQSSVSPAISLSVTGRALDYQLTRRAALAGPTLRLDYRLENKSSAPMPFLWAAHPLFKGEPDCQVWLPQDVTQVINAVDHPLLGKPDTLLAWPTTKITGESKALDVAGAARLRDYRKMYVPPQRAIGAASLRRGARALAMTWDSAAAPYLGIWFDEGAYTPITSVALEPATGYYDALDAAYRNQRVAVAPVGQPVTWWLEVRFADANNAPDG